MIGVTISDIILAFQSEGVQVLKSTRGDMSLVINHALSDLYTRDILSSEDKDYLENSFGEALDVLAGRKSPPKALKSAQKRYALMVADKETSDVARALAELCRSVIIDAVAVSKSKAKKGVAKSIRVPEKGEQTLFWGIIGASVGAAIGGAVGSVIGAAIGAALGSCGDNETTFTIKNNGSGYKQAFVK